MSTADSRSRFSDRVEDYVKYRPSYPDASIDWIIEQSGVDPEAKVADIGSGTGISSKLFLDRGYDVIGVEPNQAMRQAAERLLGGYGRFTSIEGSAEATTLMESSVDLVIAGQAFHWFDRSSFRAECQRILKPGGSVALFWNERLVNATPFLAEYEALLRTFATDYAKVDHRRMDDQVIAGFYGRMPAIASFPNVQSMDFDGLKGRLMSSSYMPDANHARTPEMLSELRRLFDKNTLNGRVDLLYETKVYCGRLG
jgi:SAM-dependent methyltransferase